MGMGGVVGRQVDGWGWEGAAGWGGGVVGRQVDG